MEMLSWHGLAGGLIAIVVAVAFEAKTVIDRGPAGLFNDFYLYWGAVRLLATRHNPYDLAALQSTLAHAGVHATLGLGYPYPLFMAFLLLPLGLASPHVAAAIFSALSLACFGLAVALLLTPMRALPRWEMVLLAVAAGGLVPVRGSLHFGQVNLLLLVPLALAFRGIGRTVALAVASAIKLYPVAGFAALLRGGTAERRQLAVGLALTLSLALLPNVLTGFGGGHLLDMFSPDPYWSNQSIDGWLSRMAIAGQLSWLGLPVTPLMLALTALLGLLTLGVVLHLGGRPWDGCLALLLTFGLVAAPRNSLWNFVPLMLPMAWCWPRVRLRPPLLAVLLLGWLMVELQSNVNLAEVDLYRQSVTTGLLSSLGLYGSLLIGGLTAYLLLEAPRPRLT